jgi:hypothetical protein
MKAKNRMKNNNLSQRQFKNLASKNNRPKKMMKKHLKNNIKNRHCHLEILNQIVNLLQTELKNKQPNPVMKMREDQMKIIIMKVVLKIILKRRTAHLKKRLNKKKKALRTT